MPLLAKRAPRRRKRACSGVSAPNVTPLSWMIGVVSRIGSQLTFCTCGARNSSSRAALAGTSGLDGTINIRPGDRIPLIPRQLLKVFADYAATPVLTLNAGLVAVAGSLARGNENNTHQPDGKYYLGPGQSAGYAVFNVGASYRVNPQWQLTAQINNVFDARYETAAQLGSTGFDASGNFVARPFGGSAAAGYPLQHSTFYAPGAPRAISVTLKYALR